MPVEHNTGNSSPNEEDASENILGEDNKQSPSNLGRGAALTPQHGEPKPYTERLTAKQAGEEIKRLRREVYGLRNILKEREAELEREKEELKGIQENSISIRDARKLTLKAIQKGKALQYLETVSSRNSCTYSLLRESFRAIILNCYGWSYVKRKVNDKGHHHTELSYTDECVKLLRTEQLTLLAENEKLISAVKALQKQDDYFLDDGSGLLKSPQKKSLVNYYARCELEESNIPKNARKGELNRELEEKKQFTSLNLEKTIGISGEDSVVEVDSDLVYANLKTIGAIMKIIEVRTLGIGFRRLMIYLYECRKISEKNSSISIRTKVMGGVFAQSRSSFAPFLSILLPIIANRLKFDSARALRLLHINAVYTNSTESMSLFGPNNQTNNFYKYRIPPRIAAFSKKNEPYLLSRQDLDQTIYTPHYMEALPSVKQFPTLTPRLPASTEFQKLPTTTRAQGAQGKGNPFLLRSL